MIGFVDEFTNLSDARLIVEVFVTDGKIGVAKRESSQRIHMGHDVWNPVGKDQAVCSKLNSSIERDFNFHSSFIESPRDYPWVRRNNALNCVVIDKLANFDDLSTLATGQITLIFIVVLALDHISEWKKIGALDPNCNSFRISSRHISIVRIQINNSHFF